MHRFPRSFFLASLCVFPSLAIGCGGGSSADDGGGTGAGAATSAGAGGSAVGAGGKSNGGGAGGSHAGAANGNTGGKAGNGAGGSAGASGAGGAGGAGGKSGGGAGGAGGSGKGGASGAAGNAGKAGAAGKGGTGGAPAGGMGGTSAATCKDPIALQVMPGTVQIDVTNGTSAPVTLQAIGICADQSTSPLSATWTFDRADLATIGTGSGILTASNDKGGEGTVTATSGALSGQAGVTVMLHVELNPGALDPSEIAALGGPGTDPADPILYPYDQTVFARGILAPELMWGGGAAGDSYLIHLQEKFTEVKVYAKLDPPGRFQMDDPTWSALTVSNAGEDVSVDIVRSSGGVVHLPAHEAWKIAQGSLRGSIYYWAVNLGQIVKIAPGAAAPTPVFDSGPASSLGTPAPVSNYDGSNPPWQPNDQSNRCVACHTVARNGSKLSSVFSRAAPGSTGPWGTVDLTTGMVSTVGPYSDNVDFEALTPDGARIVANTTDMHMHLADASTAAPISSLLDSFVDLTCDPAFAQDGTKLAFAGSVVGSYPVEFSQSNLDVVDYDDNAKVFSNRKTVVPGNGQAIAFPSFSPGSDMIVYQKGDYSRAKYGANLHGNDELFLTDLAGQLGEVNLARANGAGILDAKNQHLSYQPTVNPIAVGGYFWVVFVSPRDYGNRMVSTTDPTYENHKQLWVTAVDLNPAPGVDPSHPAFLLRGQDLATTNMSGYWSLEACHQNGTSCSEGFECCTGFCREDATGMFSCVDMPPNACSKVGEKCSSTGDCCDAGKGVTCVGGTCSVPKP